MKKKVGSNKVRVQCMLTPQVLKWLHETGSKMGISGPRYLGMLAHAEFMEEARRPR